MFKANPATFRYIQLRTRLAISLDDSPFDALWNAGLHGADLLKLGPDAESWENGLLLRIYTSESVSALAARLRSGLDQFEAWGIHDAHSKWAESVPNGPLSRYFEETITPGTTARQSAILFLLDGERDRDPDRTADAIRLSLSAKCLPVFHFLDGRLLMAPGPLPFQLIMNRTARARQPLRGFAGCDSDGDPFPTSDEDIWEWVELDDLAFGGAGSDGND